MPSHHTVPLTEGTITGDLRSRVDGEIFAVRNGDRALTLAIENDHLSYRAVTGNQRMILDLEDIDTIADDTWHSFAVRVGDSGTQVFVDGYQALAGTSTDFLAAVGSDVIEVPDGSDPQVRALVVHPEVLSDREILAAAVRPEPLTQFAAAHLSDYDVARLRGLRTGAVWARFRVRGEGQGGVILAAGGAGTEQLRLKITGDRLVYQMLAGNGRWRDFTTAGHWADGDWHDVAVRVATGAVDLYVDGFREAHLPGQAFFADVAGLDCVAVGQDTRGARLFGEVQRAAIYPTALTDAQIKRLAHVEPVSTQALFDRGYAGSASYRIPSLLALPSGVLIAGADQRTTIPNDTPNHINFVIRRSLDGGGRWEDLQTVVASAGAGRDGASVTDPCSVYDRLTGQVLVVMDRFPGGIGQPNSRRGVGLDPRGRQLLRDREGAQLILDEDGTVRTPVGEATRYHVDSAGDVTTPDGPGGNIYLKDGSDPNQTVLIEQTSYLVQVTSDDEGATWSKPRHLNHQVKEPWMGFLGSSPGTGIQLEHGPHAGRLVVPVYYNGDHLKRFSAAVIYSDDHGHTWVRGASPNDGREFAGQVVDSRTLGEDQGSLYESTVFERDDGTMVLLMRNQHASGRVATCVSIDGGQTWGPVSYHPQLPEIFSQPNAIRLPSSDGKEWAVFANASQLLPYRGSGTLRLSDDGGHSWSISRSFNPGHYVYQSMAWLPNQRLGLLWENEWQGLYLTQLPLEWFGVGEIPTGTQRVVLQ